MDTVPTVLLEHLTDEQVRAYVIADNKLAECAGWDRDLLEIELQGLAEIDLDFDLEVMGFEAAEIDLLIGGEAEEGEPDPADCAFSLSVRCEIIRFFPARSESPNGSEHPSIPGATWKLGPNLHP